MRRHYDTDITESRVEKLRRKRERKMIIILLSICIPLGLAGLGFIICTTHFFSERIQYDNVDYDWDDDRNRYDIFIPGLETHYYVPTNEAVIVFVDDSELQNSFTLERYETLVTHHSIYKTPKFYINACWFNYHIGVGE